MIMGILKDEDLPMYSCIHFNIFIVALATHVASYLCTTCSSMTYMPIMGINGTYCYSSSEFVNAQTDLRRTFITTVTIVSPRRLGTETGVQIREMGAVFLYALVAQIIISYTCRSHIIIMHAKEEYSLANLKLLYHIISKHVYFSMRGNCC